MCLVQPPPSSKPPPMAASGLLALSSPSSMTATHASPPLPSLLSFPCSSSSNHAHHPFRALLFLGKPHSRPFLPPSVFALGSLVTAHEAPTTPMAAVDAASSQLVQPPIDAHFRLPPNIPTVLTMQPDSVAPFLLEDLLTGEEAVVAAAAAEAVALAKAAVNVAKGAALLAGGDWVPSMEYLNDTSDGTADMNELATKTWSFPSVHENHALGDASVTLMQDVELLNYACRENSLLEMDQPEIVVAVQSVRQLERKNIKERTAEKPCANFISVKGGVSSRKKRSAVQEIDYSDPLRYLRNTTSTSKLLTATEELEFSEGIQDLLKLERLYDELTERFGGRPTFAQWASAAGINQRMLRKRLNYGILCKDKMIKSNIRLVISIAKNYQGAGMNLQDLVQEGCRGLVRGAEKFDASKGFKFSTYAHWWIKQAVRKSLSDQSRTIRLPFHMVEATYRVREAKKQIYSETGRHPDNKEIAEATGLSMKRLNAVLLTPKAPRSLDQKIGINQNLKPSEVIADPEAETTEDILIKQFMKRDLNKVLDTLNPRERRVIRCRFGLEDGRMRTLQEIGELMGVSRERIRQIESCAFRKLKNKKRTKLLRQYFIS